MPEMENGMLDGINSKFDNTEESKFEDTAIETNQIEIEGEKYFVKNKHIKGWAWWFISIIPATQEVETGGSQLKARLGKN
jgi:hypothetical protein